MRTVALATTHHRSELFVDVVASGLAAVSVQATAGGVQATAGGVEVAAAE